MLIWSTLCLLMCDFDRLGLGCIMFLLPATGVWYWSTLWLVLLVLAYWFKNLKIAIKAVSLCLSTWNMRIYVACGGLLAFETFVSKMIFLVATYIKWNTTGISNWVTCAASISRYFESGYIITFSCTLKYFDDHRLQNKEFL